MSKIAEALRQLDPSNNNHWTGDGLPRLETLRMMAGSPGISREDVEAAAPGFNQKSAAEAKKTPAPEVLVTTQVPVFSEKPIEQVTLAPAGLATMSAGDSIEMEKEIRHSEFVEIADLEAELAIMRAEHAKNTQIIAQAQTELDVLYEKRDKEAIPDHRKTQSDIRAYLDSQQAEREKRSGPSERSRLDMALQMRKRQVKPLNPM